MKPMARAKSDKNFDYEKVPTDDWVKGIIEDIQRDETRETEWEGKKKITDSIRFKFKLEGCKFPHYSKWMSFTYAPKGNLAKILKALVKGWKDWMDFDLASLKGMPVKTMWSTSGQWQNLDTIRPLEDKTRDMADMASITPLGRTDLTDDEIPF